MCDLAKVNRGDVLKPGLRVLHQGGFLLLKGLREVDPAYKKKVWVNRISKERRGRMTLTARLEETEDMTKGLLWVWHEHEAATEVGSIKPVLCETIHGLVNHLQHKREQD